MHFRHLRRYALILMLILGTVLMLVASRLVNSFIEQHIGVLTLLVYKVLDIWVYKKLDAFIHHALLLFIHMLLPQQTQLLNICFLSLPEQKRVLLFLS
jgi:hypothetical protein